MNNEEIIKYLKENMDKYSKLASEEPEERQQAEYWGRVMAYEELLLEMVGSPI